MNCICILIIWLLFCQHETKDFTLFENKPCERPCEKSCICKNENKSVDVCDRKCEMQDDLPFLPGGRPFGAFDGNQTCGCEEKPV